MFALIMRLSEVKQLILSLGRVFSVRLLRGSHSLLGQ